MSPTFGWFQLVILWQNLTLCLSKFVDNWKAFFQNLFSASFWYFYNAQARSLCLTFINRRLLKQKRTSKKLFFIFKLLLLLSSSSANISGAKSQRLGLSEVEVIKSRVSLAFARAWEAASKIQLAVWKKNEIARRARNSQKLLSRLAQLLKRRECAP